MRASRGVWRPPWLPLLVVGLCSAVQQTHQQSQLYSLTHHDPSSYPRPTPPTQPDPSSYPRPTPPTQPERRGYTAGLVRNDAVWVEDTRGVTQEHANQKQPWKQFVPSTSPARIGSDLWKEEKNNNLEPYNNPNNRDRFSSSDLVLPYYLSSNVSQPATGLNFTGSEEMSLFSELHELRKVSNKPRRSYSNKIGSSPSPWRDSSSSGSNRDSLSLASYLQNKVAKEPFRQESYPNQGVRNNRPLRSTSHSSRIYNNLRQGHFNSGNHKDVEEVNQPLGFIELARREITAVKFHPLRSSQVSPTRKRKPSLFDPIIAQLKREAEEAKRLENSSSISKENSVYEAESNGGPGRPNPWLQTTAKASGTNYNQWYQVSSSTMGNNQVSFNNVGRNHWHQSSSSDVVRNHWHKRPTRPAITASNSPWYKLPASTTANNQWHKLPSSSSGNNEWHQTIASGMGNNEWHLVTNTGSPASLPSGTDTHESNTQHNKPQQSLFQQLGALGGPTQGHHFPTQHNEHSSEEGKRPQPSFLEESPSHLVSSFGTSFPSDLRGWSVTSNWTFTTLPLTVKSFKTKSGYSAPRQRQRPEQVVPLLEGLPLPTRAAPLLEEQDPEVTPGLFQGDIALQSPEDMARFRVGVNWEVFPHLRWVNGTVPYVISSLYLPEEHHMIQTSIATLNFLSCVRFVPWDGVAEDYLLIWPVEAPKGCWSYVGRRGGQQVVSLQRPDASSTRCFGSLGKPLHELLHAVGVFHEHTRADRDDYVQVLVNNIVPQFVSNFQKQGLVNTSNSFAYDYDSVMHYGSHFFSRNGLDPTIVPHNPLVHIGQREMISKRDCLKLNALYGCLEQGTDQLDMYTALCNNLAL